jgi:hypothetical protein
MGLGIEGDEGEAKFLHQAVLNTKAEPEFLIF